MDGPVSHETVMPSSAHFADDGIEIFGRSSINYAKDYLILLGSWRIPAVEGALYAGGHWDYQQRVIKNIMEEQKGNI